MKRVIGLPGETIEVKFDGVYINGTKLNEPWLHTGIPEGPTYGPKEIPQGTYFVMGDNRSNSSDSRSSAVGPVPKNHIVGRAIILVWPPKRVGGI